LVYALLRMRMRHFATDGCYCGPAEEKSRE
jgi:hypothetical protein